MKNKLFSFVILLTLLIFSACSPGSNTQTPAQGEARGEERSESVYTVTVSVLPQKYFLERIGGEYVRVNVMVLPGGNPHTYEPTPEQMKLLSDSMAYFSTGVDFEESWLERFQSANQDMKMVDTIQNIDRREMEGHHHHEDEEDEGEHHHEEEEDGEEHHHEDEEHEGEHTHEGENLDPHVWTSPELVLKQTEVIYQTLVDIDPKHQMEYQENLEQFRADIMVLQEDIRQTLSDLGTRKFMVFHPSWGYFADEFNLEQIPVEVGGQEPSPQELAEIIQLAREENIRVIFVQPTINPQTAETIAREIEGEVLQIDPLAEDWMDNLRRVADTFASVLEN